VAQRYLYTSSPASLSFTWSYFVSPGEWDGIALFLNFSLFTLMFPFYSTTSTVQVYIGKNLSYAFSIQNGLKQGDALSLLLFKFALVCAVRKILEKGLVLNETNQFPVYAGDYFVKTYIS
jgi:hypothetical protein